jgi:hypothetical protein
MPHAFWYTIGILESTGALEIQVRYLATYLIYCKTIKFNKSAFELQNIEQEISNFEVLAKASWTSAVRNSLFDILNFKYFCLTLSSESSPNSVQQPMRACATLCCCCKVCY